LRALKELRRLVVRKIQAVLAILWLNLALTSWGQNTTGSIVGAITDSTGASLPNAQVTIVRVETGDSRLVTTNEKGDFTAQLLKPGNYTVTVSAAGFKKAERTGLILQVDRVDRADFALQVGVESQTVTVQSGALTLDTDSSEVGQTIGEQQVTEIPLNGREFTSLLFLTPGVVQQTGEQNQFRYDGGGAIAIEGSRSESNGYLIDGTSIMDYGYGVPAYNISLDAIQEFNVQTDTYSAQYGYSANQINISSKSGTNQFHGSAFEYIRNNAVDARNYFLPASVSASPLRQNQFGYSFGGPVWIPKIYDGHNKTFFFANYEGQRIRATQPESGLVPTAAEVAGTFPFALYDPLTYNPVTGTEQLFPQNADGSTTLPADRISRFGKVIQSNPTYWWPLPNTTGAHNFVAGVGAPVNTDQQNYRIDQQFGARDAAFFRAAKSDILAVSPTYLTPIGNVDTVQAARNYTLTETHTFKPNLLNQFRIGYLEFQVVRGAQPANPADITAIGLTNLFVIPDGGYTEIQFSGYSDPTRPDLHTGQSYSATGGANNAPTENLESMWDIEDDVSWNKAQHTITLGMGIRRPTYQTNNITNPQGTFTEDGEFSGNQIADVLLGNPNGADGSPQLGPLGNATSGPKPHILFQTYAPYAQDDWKVTKNLTVNAGLRYEFNAVPYDKGNTLAWFDSALPGGGIGVADPKIVSYGGGVYIYNGQRGPGPVPKNDFVPRLGFAYRPFRNDRTVVRGGYGMFMDTSQGNEWAYSTGIYPYYTGQNLHAAWNNGTILNTNDLFAPPPKLTYSPSTSPTQLADTHFKNPYVANYTFGIQRELFKNTVLDMNYTGNRGFKLMTRLEVNQALPCVAPACSPDPTSPNYETPASRNPYPNFGNFLIDNTWIGYSRYNGLNVKLERRGSNLTVLAAYTWSKGLDIKSLSSGLSGDAAGWIDVQNAHDPNADYARSSYDVGQRLAVSFIGQLPVGRGKQFAGNVNRGVDAVIGGWQVSGVGIFQGGFPFTIEASDINGFNESDAERANIVGNPNLSKKDPTHWFNTAAFAQPAVGTFGDSSRNAVRAPGVERMDLTVGKSFSLAERVRLQIRFESFNALNHPQFGFPDSGVNDGAAFGTITSTASDNRENQGAIRLTF
jgi:hypothetical protein